MMDLNTEASLAITKLSYIAKKLGVADVANHLLKDDKFLTWTGSSKPFLHHYGDHGLLLHTCEVVETSESMRIFYKYKYDIDKVELFFAGLFHDAGKIYDYEKVDGVWHSSDHKRNIHHISRSALIWNDAVRDTRQELKYKDTVLHAILSHHGQREWGSPVAPLSRVAWLVFLCDSISARLYDADTRDVVHSNSPRK